MSDDAQHDNTTLASLYLDDEATADERALVETSADALAEADELGEVRAVLGATAPVAPLSEREAHLAGALGVWDRMSDLERSGELTPTDGVEAAAAAALMTPAAGSRRERSHRRRQVAGLSGSQWLLGAAAALLIVVAAGAVVRSFLVDQDVDDGVAVEAPTTEAAASELSDLEAQEAAEVQGENVGDELDPSLTDLSDDAAGSGLFPDDGVEEDSDDAGAAADRTDDEATAAEARSADSLPGPEQPPPPPEDEIIAIDNVDDLAVYASLAIRGLEATTADNDDIDFEAPFGSCEAELGVEEELEPVEYAGVEVVVGVDLDNSLVLAYTREECEIVETTSLPIDDGGVVDEP